MVTITMRIHPEQGMALAVVFFRRNHDTGRRFVVVAHPRGGQLWVPVDWTDRGTAQPVPRVGEQEVVADAAALRRLARAVEDCKKKLDTHREDTLPRVLRVRDASSGSTGSPPGVVGTTADDTTEGTGRVGDVGPQGAAAKRGER
jgi:hypothetical protein